MTPKQVLPDQTASEGTWKLGSRAEWPSVRAYPSLTQETPRAVLIDGGLYKIDGGLDKAAAFWAAVLRSGYGADLAIKLPADVGEVRKYEDYIRGYFSKAPDPDLSVYAVPGLYPGLAEHLAKFEVAGPPAADAAHAADLHPPSPADPAEIAATARSFLLDPAAPPTPPADALQARTARIRGAALDMLGGESVLGRALATDEALIAALHQGFPGDVLRRLQEVGYPHEALEQVIAPRRTLMRRRAPGQRLTCEESDAAWRLALALASAIETFGSAASARDWLLRPKPAFNDARPVDLLRTSVGSAHVERLLRQLDWGDAA